MKYNIYLELDQDFTHADNSSELASSSVKHYFKNVIEIGVDTENGSLYEAYFDSKQQQFAPLMANCKNISKTEILQITHKLNSKGASLLN